MKRKKTGDNIKQPSIRVLTNFLKDETQRLTKLKTIITNEEAPLPETGVKGINGKVRANILNSTFEAEIDKQFVMFGFVHEVSVLLATGTNVRAYIVFQPPNFNAPDPEEPNTIYYNDMIMSQISYVDVFFDKEIDDSTLDGNVGLFVVNPDPDPPTPIAGAASSLGTKVIFTLDVPYNAVGSLLNIKIKGGVDGVKSVDGSYLLDDYNCFILTESNPF